MDCERRWHENSSNSVIAVLMSLNELPYQQQPPLYENRRVLSESYIQKSASVGRRPGSSVERRLRSRNSSSSSSNILNGVDRSIEKCANLITTSKVVESLSRARNEDDGKLKSRKKVKDCALRNVLRYMQKLERDSLSDELGVLGIDDIYKSLKFRLKSIDKPSLVSKSVIAYDRRSGSIACPTNMNRISREESWRSKFENDAPQLFLSSSLANGSKNQSLRKWKTANDVESLDEVLALTDKKSKSINMNHGLGKNDLKASFEETGETFSSGCNLMQDESTSVTESSSPSSKISTLSIGYSSCFGSEYKHPEASVESSQNDLDNSSENHWQREIAVSQGVLKHVNDDDIFANTEAFSISDDHQSESSPVVLKRGVGHASYVVEVFSQEASLNEFSKDEAKFSNFSSVGPPKFQDYARRTNQHSPDSVLEPLGVQNYSSFEHFESIGLKLQLQALNIEHEETYSEGSVMVISGDEDTGENIVDHSPYCNNVIRWLGDDQSRKFSYLVDILDEAAIFGTKSFMDFKKWDSVEYPISPSVFEALEKKYGKQNSWFKCERQLLFDRINSGLIDIFCNFHASIKRRVCFSLRRDEVENELWMMLVSQEKEKSKDYLSEKALGKWVGFEEGISIICRELETPIFDELVMELVSL